MRKLPIAAEVLRAGTWTGAAEKVELTHAERHLRRKRLVTDSGRAFRVDLPEKTRLFEKDAFRLSDGSLVEVVPAREDLLEVTGRDLLRLAWHVGHRRAPCQIESGRLLVPQDSVLEALLKGLGGKVKSVSEPFEPEDGMPGRAPAKVAHPEPKHGKLHVESHVSHGGGEADEDILPPGPSSNA
ncbi:urease accessory protein UreE [Ostreiculturibacter nitratireducens]|uniref:urease accessory protein UreE n=1 Tax=Ostreiculturibacter nitratireducens TaxID=3075226 RepID=UPI0031B571DE